MAEVHVAALRHGEHERDHYFAALLMQEDKDEESGLLSPHDRLTCHLHRKWVHRCIASSLHVIPVTGHRWCARCRAAVTVSVDEVHNTVALACSSCGGAPSSLASRQIVRTCRASVVAARRGYGLI